MVRFEWLLVMQIFLLVFMFIFYQKLVEMKKQVDDITKEVANYISYVTEEIELENQGESIINAQNTRKKESEDAQNRLIQAVLGDFFP